jgi:hypothetical protein
MASPSTTSSVSIVVGQDDNVSNPDHEDLGDNIAYNESSDLGVDSHTTMEMSLEDYTVYHDSNVPPDLKTHWMITLCFAYIDGFRTDVPPSNHKIFDNKKRHHIPKLESYLKKESKRRFPKKRTDQMVVVGNDPPSQQPPTEPVFVHMHDVVEDDVSNIQESSFQMSSDHANHKQMCVSFSSSSSTAILQMD